MALERVPADIRSQGGVARMSDPKMIKEIMDTVTIPVIAKARIGHFVECQVRPAIPLSTPHLQSPPPPSEREKERGEKEDKTTNIIASHRSSKPSA